jgi:hypothetical protein
MVLCGQVVGQFGSRKRFLCETLRFGLGDLCGLALYFTSYRKVRQGLRKERKKQTDPLPCGQEGLRTQLQFSI